YGFNMQTNNQYAGALWNGYYAMINRIDRLEVITKKLMEDAPADAAAHEDNLAELYALRAFAHYKLFAYFTPNYTNNSGMSAFILNDLEQADDLRNRGWAGEINYANPGLIEAIRVKLYSTTEEWDKVLTHGQIILNQPVFALANAKEYTELFARVEDPANHPE